MYFTIVTRLIHTVAVLAEFHWGLSVSSMGADGGRAGWVCCGSLFCRFCRFSTWLRSRQIFSPAQNRSNDNNPFGGVTFLKLSITPLGSPFVPSSCQRLSISTIKKIKDCNFVQFIL
jgi:hypothetical protein